MTLDEANKIISDCDQIIELDDKARTATIDGKVTAEQLRAILKNLEQTN